MKEGISFSEKKQRLQRNAQGFDITFTDEGTWMHSTGSDFVFAYVDKSWDQDLKNQVAAAFKAALKIPATIKEAVKTTSGQDVVNGLYLLDQVSMVKALNSIDGMGQVDVTSHTESGSGTAVSINQEFFAAILGGLGGDVAPMMTYLNDQMGDIQAQTEQSTVTDNFGSVVGLISVMPELGVIESDFTYVFSSQSTSSWFVTVNCGSSESYSYDYTCTVVKYVYDPSTVKK